MIRPGRDPPGHPPESRLPDFSKSPHPGGWGVFLCVPKRIEEKVAVPPPFASACHERACPVPSKASDPDSQQQVSNVPRSEASLKRSCWVASSEPCTSMPVVPSARFLDALGSLQRKQLVPRAAKIRLNL